VKTLSQPSPSKQLSFLELNGVPLNADEDALYDFVIAVTTGELRETKTSQSRCGANKRRTSTDSVPSTGR
jgi:prophage maintenance system killer protein